MDREHIIREIKTIAESNGGVPPGKGSFAKITGITESHWSGKFWARWSDAVQEAGYVPNKSGMDLKLDSTGILRSLAKLTSELGKFPSVAEMKMKRRSDDTFPHATTIQSHFGLKSELMDAFRKFCDENAEFSAIGELLSRDNSVPGLEHEPSDGSGWVYLFSYGRGRYKIGLAKSVERRFVTLDGHSPDEMEIIWKIRTDDPAGVEDYWHKRFAQKWIRKEYFELSKQDVAAFKRWQKIH